MKNDKQWILHCWSDEECIKILKRCKEAIGSNKEKRGKLIIINMKVENQKAGDHDDSMETQLFFDMLMMILSTGRAKLLRFILRTIQFKLEQEWAKLFFDAGFSDYKITPILGLTSLIEVYP
ncbi:putative O-methyltransferase 3 [Camellia lanceoleosa]|uniref:O-methyltransferase 3 n=1 Tax=Camellia lanceoleosa TaxID=1840588 RepID=A0ACC0HH63_9ERIC|nr:putative O-methyltransferase 3 [Camellia lanceoleosa]